MEPAGNLPCRSLALRDPELDGGEVEEDDAIPLPGQVDGIAARPAASV